MFWKKRREKIEHYPEDKAIRRARVVKHLKWLSAVLAVILLCLIGWIAFSASKAMNNISDSGFKIGQIFTKTNLKSTNGRTNIILLGNGGSNHPGGQLTDTNILLVYDQNTKKAAMVSFPRDLFVTIAKGGGKNKLNYAYAYGELNIDKTGGGAVTAKETMESIAGVPIHYYVEVDFVGFKDIVDSLGGVTVNVDKAINDPYYPKDYFDDDGNYHKTDAYSPFKIAVGKQYLDGTTALKYARSRETTSDFDRSQRQQKLISAIKDKALSIGVLTNPKKLTDLLSAISNHFKTDLNASEMKSLASLVKNLSSDRVEHAVVDNGNSGLLVSSTSSAGAYILLPKKGNYSDIQALVKNVLSSSSTAESLESSSASTELIQDASGSVELYNGSGVDGQARAMAPKLEKLGIQITTLKTTSEVYEKSVLYDFTGGKDKATVKAIKALIPGIPVISRSGEANKADFRLIIGEDYV